MKKKVKEVHDEWQIDAKENLTLQDGSRACYLNIVDKKSGAVLASHCFGKKNINQVKETVVRDALIDSFQNWGKPKSIRVDNGHPLGDPQRKSISTLGLWIIACGIDLIYNRPRRPTDNASVERMQQTTKNWAEIRKAKNLEDLQLRLDHIGVIQRESYKVSRLKNQTRKEIFPQLWLNPNEYQQKDFAADRAFATLEQRLLVRIANKSGRIALYGHYYTIGRKYARLEVAVRFISATCSWEVFDKTGKFLKRIFASNFTKERLWDLTLPKNNT
ncbi:MAG: hypothetical protein MK212_02650 [Saprospiraceae bacterium]|nr:hypothetical protein [Saprospiraceae bacterium]